MNQDIKSEYQNISEVITTTDSSDVKCYTSKGWRLLIVSEKRIPDTADKEIVYALGLPFGQR